MALHQEDRGGTKERIIAAVFASSGLFLTILFFAPLQIYLSNRIDLPYAFPKVFFYFLTIAFCSVLLVFPLLAALPSVFHKKSIALMGVVSFLVWLQGNILVSDYGVFDGRHIRWDTYSVRGFVDASIWLGGIIFGIKKSKLLYRFIRALVIWLILVQVIATLYFMVQPKRMPMIGYDFSTNNLYYYSTNRNVVVLLFDGFQNDLFQEIIDEDSSFKDTFAGFTYFRNALGGYATTTPSLGLIFTGRYYDNSIPYEEFGENEVFLHSFPKVLKDNGFNVEFYPFFAPDTNYSYFDLASNSRKGSSPGFSLDFAVRCYKVVLFRYAPYSFKKYCLKRGRNPDKWINLFDTGKLFYAYQKMRNSLGFPPAGTAAFSSSRIGMVTFFNLSAERVTLLPGPDTFKFIHLSGLHPPLEFDERLQSVLLPENRLGYKSQAKGILKLVSLFLTRLKQVGGYDNAMIVIIGDHGIDDGVYFDRSYHSSASHDQGRSLPLVLIKPFGSHKGMTISDVPVSLGDLPQTVMVSLGMQADFPGVSMFALDPAEERTRRFLSGISLKGDFIPMLTEFNVIGPSWEKESWHATGRKFTAPSGKASFNYRLMAEKIAALCTEW